MRYLACLAVLFSVLSASAQSPGIGLNKLVQTRQTDADFTGSGACPNDGVIRVGMSAQTGRMFYCGAGGGWSALDGAMCPSDPPSGSCSTGSQTACLSNSRGAWYSCQSGNWKLASGPPACVGDPPSGACTLYESCIRVTGGAFYTCPAGTWVQSGATSSGASGTAQTSNGTGGFSALTAIQSQASGAAYKLAARYVTVDADGDGVLDGAQPADYDGDGTLEVADLETAINAICDANADGTQDRAISLDTDHDGTFDDTEYRCGTITVAPGRYLGSTTDSQLYMPWSGVTLDLDGVILQSQLDTNKLFSSTAGGSLSFSAVLYVGNGTGTPVTRRVRVNGGTIVGVGWGARRAKCVASSCTDGLDADNDGTGDGAEYGVLSTACDDCVFDRMTIRDIDRIGWHTSVDAGAFGLRQTLSNSTIFSTGEHCIEVDTASATITGNNLTYCGAINEVLGAIKMGGRACEIYFNGTINDRTAQGLVFAHNYVEFVTDGVATIYGTATVNIKDWVITGNTFRSIRGNAIKLQTQSANHTIQGVTITGNMINGATAANTNGIYIDVNGGGTIRDVTLAGNSVVLSATGAAAGSGILRGIVYESDGGAVTGNTVDIVSDGTVNTNEYDYCGLIQGSSFTFSGNTCRLNTAAGKAGGWFFNGVDKASIGPLQVSTTNSQTGFATGYFGTKFSTVTNSTISHVNCQAASGDTGLTCALVSTGATGNVFDHTTSQYGFDTVRLADSSTNDFNMVTNTYGRNMNIFAVDPVLGNNNLYWNNHCLDCNADDDLTSSQGGGISTLCDSDSNGILDYDNDNNGSLDTLTSTAGACRLRVSDRTKLQLPNTLNAIEFRTPASNTITSSLWVGTCGATECLVFDLDASGTITSADDCFIDGGIDADCDGTAATLTGD